MYPFDPVLTENNYLHEPLIFEDYFTAEECQRIIDECLTGLSMTPGGVASGEEDEEDTGGIDPKIRLVDKYEFTHGMPELKSEFSDWIFPKLEDLIMQDANHYYNFDIRCLDETINLLHYRMTEHGGGHYVTHTDFGPEQYSTRKMTCIVQLSDPSEYEGCDLVLLDYDDGNPAPKARGTVIAFPPWMSHHVTPLISGNRYCLNLWANGPAFR